MKPRVGELGASAYVSGPVMRFSEKYMMFRRVMWDSPDLARRLYFTPKHPKADKPGYTLLDMAFRNATWDLERDFGMGNRSGNAMLTAWERPTKGEFAPPQGLKLESPDPAAMSLAVKKVARFAGASLVGIAALDMRWVYSHSYIPAIKNPFLGAAIPDEELTNGQERAIEIDPAFKWAIVIAVEMDYRVSKYSPTYLSGAGAGLGYSKMPFYAALVAQFIRGLGYRAIPQGNDTSLAVPLAIDAGLGELGRNGLLITPRFGPRVRLAKVFTDLPLAPDKPLDMGVWEFCRACKKCAKHCPSQSIPHGEPSEDIHNVSNRPGLYRWAVNGETCIAFWEKNNSASCLNCIRVCPFNKPDGWMHDAVRWGIRRFPVANRLFVWGDDVFGYSRRGNPARYWERP